MVRNIDINLGNIQSEYDVSSYSKSGLLGNYSTPEYAINSLLARGANFLVEVSKENVVGHGNIRIFGEVPSVAASTPADIWEYGQTPGAELYTFSTTADIDTISSSSASDTEEITIEGLDADYVEVIQTKNLNGRNKVVLDTPLMVVNRAYNSNGTNLLGNVYIYVDGTISNGVPTDVTTVRGYISIGNGQTLQSIYTIPAGKTGYFMGYKSSLTKGVGATVVSGTVTLKTRQAGKVNRIQECFTLVSNGTSFANVVYSIPEKYNEKTIFIPNIDVSANNIGVSFAYIIMLVDN